HSKYAGEKLITELLPVLDTLDAALAAEKNKSQREGLAMLQKQLAGVLEKNGLAPISAHGTAFDPYYHEAVLKEKSEKPEGTVIGEILRGYTLNGKVLRHTKVKISGGIENG
ncbi:MAG: nucleotide exchange factor GrpE, partial [Candidatus Altiarchaeota archaeon]|nr:nucleotide exchange factor GrpE [Candidatus Altiarchaeota archaeon]